MTPPTRAIGPCIGSELCCGHCQSCLYSELGAGRRALSGASRRSRQNKRPIPRQTKVVGSGGDHLVAAVGEARLWSTFLTARWHVHCREMVLCLVTTSSSRRDRCCVVWRCRDWRPIVDISTRQFIGGGTERSSSAHQQQRADHHQAFQGGHWIL